MTTEQEQALSEFKRFREYKEKMQILLALGEQMAMLGFGNDWNTISSLESADLGEFVEALKHKFPKQEIRILIDISPRPSCYPQPDGSTPA